MEEFKKFNPPTFYGEMKKSEDSEAWLLWIKKFFILHNYSENMKAKIATFSLKGKVDIWWEGVKNVRGIQEEDFIWDEFERLFKNKYLYERCYDEIYKAFYELHGGSMTNYQYTSRLLEFLSACLT